MNQQLKEWRLINKAACSFKYILIQLNYWNPGDRTPRLCFPGRMEAIYRHLLRCMELPPVTLTGHCHHYHYVFLNPCETQRSKREWVLQQCLMHWGKMLCRAICVLPMLEPGLCYHSINLQEPENFCKPCQLAQARRATLLAKNHLNAAAH